MKLWKNSKHSTIIDKVLSEERISEQEAVELLKTDEINTLGFLADTVRKRIAGEEVCYSAYLNVNYTNICYLSCQLCAFSRVEGDEDAYLLSLDEIEKRVKDAYENYRINEVHIVGGVTYKAPFEYILAIMSRIRDLNLGVFIKAFTAVEIDHFARQTKLPHTEVIRQLKEAGLCSMPGGGAEIFSERVRPKIAKGKISAEKWLQVHEYAHEAGMKTNATMLYGHIENEEDIADHMKRLRDVQDKTNGFNAFIPLAFHPENTELDHIPFVDAYTDLRIYAVARIFLDNFPHLKAFWTTLGEKLAQVSLSFGVDDLGGMAIDETIMHNAGAQTPIFLKQNELVRIIETANRKPRLVNSSYE